MSFNIIYNLTDVKSASNNPTAIDTTATVVLETMYGYDLPATVTVTGADGSWDQTTGTLSLSNPTADVTITAAGAQVHYINVANLKKFWGIVKTKIHSALEYSSGDIAFGGSTTKAGNPTSGGANWYCIAIGEDAYADGGTDCIAIGRYSRAHSGEKSTAIGYNARASFLQSVALGAEANVSGGYSTAVGYYATASNPYTTSVGYYATSGGDYATSIGYNAWAGAAHAVALGDHTKTQIAYTASLYGHDNSTDISKVLLVKNTSCIFFPNVDSSATTDAYTALSQFSSGKTLAQILSSHMVTLYSGSCGYSVTLNTNYNVHDDFDILIVFCQYNSSDSQQSHTIIDTAWCNNMNNSYNFNIHENVVKLQYNPNTHVLWNDNSNCMIYKVLGIKFNVS